VLLADGYGDGRDQLLRELIGDYKGWITSMVRGIARDAPWRHEDLVQEAYIAMWQGLDRWNGEGELEGFIRQRARWRVQSLCYDGAHRRELGSEPGNNNGGSQRRGDKTRARINDFILAHAQRTGRPPTMVEAGRALGMSPSAVGKQMQKLGTVAISERASHLVESYRTTSLQLLLELGLEPISANEKMDDIEVSYHYGEIHQAVASLPEHWREYVWFRFWGGLTDAQAVRSVKETYRGEWEKHMKPHLRDELKHLSSVVG
jgi:DNA-directed RNA polymerase specialized sigma subunit